MMKQQKAVFAMKQYLSNEICYRLLIVSFFCAASRAAFFMSVRTQGGQYERNTCFYDQGDPDRSGAG